MLKKGLWHKNQACHANLHFELKIANILSVLHLKKYFENKKIENDLGYLYTVWLYLERFSKKFTEHDFCCEGKASLGQFCPNWALKLPQEGLTFEVNIAFGGLFRRSFDLNYFQIFYFFLFSEHFSSCKTFKIFQEHISPAMAESMKNPMVFVKFNQSSQQMALLTNKDRVIIRLCHRH